jgi:hypothetical protein
LPEVPAKAGQLQNTVASTSTGPTQWAPSRGGCGLEGRTSRQSARVPARERRERRCDEIGTERKR